MSQRREQFVKNVIKGINEKFGGALKAEAIEEASSGIRMSSGSAFALTLGDKRVEFDEEGHALEPKIKLTQQQLASIMKKYPREYALYCRGAITEHALAELCKV